MTNPPQQGVATVHSPRQRSAGFSLIELSIVLVIIGLIVSAVSVGMNLQRSAEYQTIKQKFVDQWVVAYNEYYSRTGTVPGDSIDTPTFIVNANEDSGAGLPAIFDWLAEDSAVVPALSRLCEGSANDVYFGARASDTTSMRDLFAAEGIRMPGGRAAGQEDRYVYLDSNGNPQELQVCFQWNPPDTPSGSGNVMVIRGLTPDLARMLDQLIDGQVNAIAGAFREQRDDPDTCPVDGSWCIDNRFTYLGGALVERNWDENQVAPVTAHLRMAR